MCQVLCVTLTLSDKRRKDSRLLTRCSKPFVFGFERHGHTRTPTVDWPFDEAFASRTAAPAPGVASSVVLPMYVNRYMFLILNPYSRPDGLAARAPTCYALVTDIGETAKTNITAGESKRAIYGLFL